MSSNENDIIFAYESCVQKRNAKRRVARFTTYNDLMFYLASLENDLKPGDSVKFRPV